MTAIPSHLLRVLSEVLPPVSSLPPKFNKLNSFFLEEILMLECFLQTQYFFVKPEHQRQCMSNF